jgi:serine/threonine-protein kinase
MDPDRLEELYERASAMGPASRERFLAESCGGDVELERELRSLLAHGASASAFFSGLAAAIVPSAIGHRIGRYTIVGVLGSGGMGTVYRAHDSQLDREVALKFLPPHRADHPGARERFLIEARAAAALEHPNVCGIHEVGETTDGRPFIAMACYDGETLAARLGRGALSGAEAMAVAVPVARALAAAHARGIIHRDVKPGNIMLGADGTVRLLDFGLAKVAEVSLTGPGATPGTIAYMSPEHARGDAVGPATDLWSLGVVLYEMLAGARPFRGGNDRAVIQAIVHEQPAPLRDAPASLRRIVERLLRKRPEERYRSADDLLADLGSGTLRSPGRTRAFAAGGAVVALAGLLSLAWPHHRSASLAGAVASAAGPATVAVLPFTVRGPGFEVWREGMVDLLSMGLDGAAGIRAIDSRTLLARWREEIGDTVVADLGRTLRFARGVGARYAVVGSAVAAGPRIRLGASLYDVASRRVLGPLQVDGPADSVLALVDRLAVQALGLILSKAPGDMPALDLASITTTSPIALKGYLAGEDHYRRSEFREAAQEWERAVRADTLFALAYLGLTDAYAWTDEAKYRDNLDRARRMANRLPPRERTVALAHWAQYVGAPGAMVTIRDALRRYPDAAEAWYALGEVYFHDAGPMAGPGEAEEAYRTAARLQPTMAPYRAHLLDLAFTWYGDSARIARELAAYRRLAPAEPRSQAGGLAFALAFGDRDTRARAAAKLATLDSEAATQVYGYLMHPAFSDVREGALPMILPRLSERDLAGARGLMFRSAALMDGRVHRALASLNDSGTAAYIRYGGALYLATRGVPVPRRLLEQSVTAGLADKSLFSSNRIEAISVAAGAARLGRWSDYESVLSRMRERAGREPPATDSSSTGYWTWAVGVTEAEGLRARDRSAEALRMFERAVSGDESWFILWQVGQLSLELGKLEQAERAFRALWRQDFTAARLQLARILDRTGRRAEAREAYQFVVHAWQRADPELQPQVEEARQAIRRLSAD